MLKKSNPIIITRNPEYNGDEICITIPDEIVKIWDIDINDVFEVILRKIEKHDG